MTEFKKTQLSNGLNLITAPLSGTDAVTVLVLLPVGSRYETPDINGVSHFVEHLMFKGTQKRPTSLDISKALDAVGAEFNAFTSKEYTGYYIKTAAEHLNLAFDVLSDMLFHSVFDETEIGKERGVIVEEINMYNDNPLMTLGSMFEGVVFSGHTLGWEVIGPKKVIRTVPRNKIVVYHQSHYQPSNMVVTVAGKVNAEKALALTRQYFGKKNANKVLAKTKKFKPTQSRPRLALRYKDTQQVQLGLGVTAYAVDSPKLYPLTVLSIILGGNMSSRLFVSVREKHGLAYFVRADIDTYVDTGVFMVHAGLDKSRIEPAIKLILSELKQVVDAGVTDKEVAEAKDFLKGKLVLQLEDSESVADWYGRQQLFHEKVATPQERLKKIQAVTAAQVQQVAKELFKTSKLNLALIGPFKDKNHFAKILKF